MFFSPPRFWAAAACLAAGAVAATAGTAAAHEPGADTETGPCLFQGLSDDERNVPSFVSSGNRVFNSAGFQQQDIHDGLSELGRWVIWKMANGDYSSLPIEPAVPQQRSYSRTTAVTLRSPHNLPGCSGSASTVGNWVWYNYLNTRAPIDWVRGVNDRWGGGAFRGAMQNLDANRDNLGGLTHSGPHAEWGWGLMAANYKGLMDVIHSENPSKSVEGAVALSFAPLRGNSALEVNALSALYRDAMVGPDRREVTEGGRPARIPHIPDINPHMGQFVKPFPTYSDGYGITTDGGLGVHDIESPIHWPDEGTAGIAKYVDSAEGDDGRWSRFDRLRTPDGAREWRINALDMANNLTDFNDFWSVPHLFNEAGYTDGVAPSGLLNIPVDGYLPGFACRISGVPEWDSPVSAATATRGQMESLRGLEDKSGIRFFIGAAGEVPTVSESVGELWAAWVACQGARGFVEGGGADKDSKGGLWSFIQGTDNAKSGVKKLLSLSLPLVNEAIGADRHIYNDRLLEGAGLPPGCGGTLPDLTRDPRTGWNNQVAPLCRYRIYTDFGIIPGGEAAYYLIANGGMWVNRAAMSGIVWITRWVYSLDLAEGAVGGMGAIFAPLNQWLREPVTPPEQPTAAPVVRQGGAGTPSDAVAGTPPPLTGAYSIARQTAADERVPRWVFYGMGIFLSFFVAWQLVMGRHTVAGKEILISMTAGTLLFWMVSTEVDNPGSWYRTVGGAAVSMIRGITDLSFGSAGADPVDLGKGIHYAPPPNYLPEVDRTERYLMWWKGCGLTHTDELLLAADSGGCVPAFPTSQGAVTERGVSAVNQKTNWTEWAKNRENWGRGTAIASLEGWSWTPPAWDSGAAPRGEWPSGPPSHWEQKVGTAGDWWPPNSFWEQRSWAARWTGDDDGIGLRLSARQVITQGRGNVLADQMGLTLGQEALNNIYYRTQWGNSLEGEEWKYCRERAWAALVRGDGPDGVRSFMEGDFRHADHWPDLGEQSINYAASGFTGGGEVRSENEPCGTGAAGTGATPRGLAEFSKHMTFERTSGPWVSAIPAVALFVAMAAQAIPVLVAQFLLAVLFAILPVIALIAIMPGAARSGLYRWVGHILRAVLTILFGMVFAILSVWVLKAVYLVPTPSLLADLFLGVAGAVAIWKLRGGMWRGATQVAAKAASGLGRAVGSKSEVSFKSDKLGEKFVREKAAAINKKRQSALRRYEAGKGRVGGGLAIAGMAVRPFTRVGGAERRDAQRRRNTSRVQAKHMGNVRQAISKMSDDDWKKAKDNDFANLADHEDYRHAFIEKDGKWVLRDGVGGAESREEAAVRAINSQRTSQKKYQAARREAAAGRRIFRGKSFFHVAAAKYRAGMIKAREPSRVRRMGGAFSEDQITFSPHDFGRHTTRDRREEQPTRERREEQRNSGGGSRPGGGGKNEPPPPPPPGGGGKNEPPPRREPPPPPPPPRSSTDPPVSDRNTPPSSDRNPEP